MSEAYKNMDHITVPKHCVCSGRYMFSYLSMQDVKTKAISPWGSLALRRECVIFYFIYLFFFIKKNSALDFSFIVPIFGAISASVFLLSFVLN